MNSIIKHLQDIDSSLSEINRVVGMVREEDVKKELGALWVDMVAAKVAFERRYVEILAERLPLPTKVVGEGLGTLPAASRRSC